MSFVDGVGRGWPLKIIQHRSFVYKPKHAQKKILLTKSECLPWIASQERTPVSTLGHDLQIFILSGMVTFMRLCSMVFYLELGTWSKGSEPYLSAGHLVPCGPSLSPVVHIEGIQVMAGKSYLLFFLCC